jgi:hypothetical protein
MNLYQRGSEWRRWDLHLHTRSSYDYEYKGDDAEALLAASLKNSDIAAAAITDHFVIDKNRIQNLRHLLPDVVFFPGVELRTDKGDTNIHVILIFDPEINLDILVESFNVFKREKGKEADNNEKIYWDFADITSFAQQHDALLSIHAGSKSNGVDDRITNRLEHNQAVKTEYARNINFYEMGKSEDFEGYRQKVFPFIGKRPLILCSDNHDPRNYNPKDKLWIKADVTFNGLKQIIFEPEERICISSIKPEQKSDYLVIDRIEICDPEFQTSPVLLNPALNCIIGGKSTGKTILLHNLALALDKPQVEEKVKISPPRTKTGVAFEVFWADGKKANESSAAGRKIIYIPQAYLNRLCDDRTEKTEIDVIIQSIVLLNECASKSFSESNNDIKGFKAELGKTILDLLEAHQSIVDQTMLMKEIGDKSGIDAAIMKMTLEKNKLTAESTLSEAEVKSYETASIQIVNVQSEIDRVTAEIESLSQIPSLLELKRITYPFSEEIKVLIEIAQQKIKTESDRLWDTQKGEILVSLRNTLRIFTEDLETQKNIELSFRDKIQSNNALAEVSNRIKAENMKLSQLIRLETQKLDKEVEKNSLIDRVVASISYFSDHHNLYAKAVNENVDLKMDDMQFSVEVPFKREAFIEKLKGIIDTRQTTFKSIISIDEFAAADYTELKIRNLIEKILSEDIALKKGNTFETALRDISDDWFEVKYKVSMDGDLLDVMSPGKKALVLLKLLLELAESKCPILIDQPEDDLDNRSIFDELIPFIRKKKKTRQIIIVTHNANIAVGADAETIIVANQNGNNAPNNEFRFEYRSGAIENDMEITSPDGTKIKGILNKQGIQQHICDILEGGVRAFELRKQKYHI